MNNNSNILPWILVAVGEAILIWAMIFFRGMQPTNILVLNIIVASIVYGLWVHNIMGPWINLRDEAQADVARLGLRWTTVVWYTVGALGVMLVCNLYLAASFQMQAILQAILLFLLILGYLSQSHAAAKTVEVYHEEQSNAVPVNEMRRAMKRLLDRADDITDLPDDIKASIRNLNDDMRYITPCNTEEAREAEGRFIDAVDNALYILGLNGANKEALESSIRRARRYLDDRKALYSR